MTVQNYKLDEIKKYFILYNISFIYILSRQNNIIFNSKNYISTVLHSSRYLIFMYYIINKYLGHFIKYNKCTTIIKSIKIHQFKCWLLNTSFLIDINIIRTNVNVDLKLFSSTFT